MIIIKLAGGLANRMFQYSLYSNFLNIGKVAFIDDKSFKPNWNFENINLKNIFPNVNYECADQYFIDKFAGNDNIFNKFRRKYDFLSRSSFLTEKWNYFNSKIFDLSGDYYLAGTWQSEKYFFNVKNIIKHDFKFPEIGNNKNILLVDELSRVESVAIHVRKGKDYNKKIVEGTCTKEYYQNAVDYLKRKIEEPKFYVFTDNVDWVKNNFKNINYNIIDWNPVKGSDNYLDMQLMSLCKHNIIANSSYSWWSAWLNNNREKIVIAPKMWYSNKEKPDLIPENWIKI